MAERSIINGHSLEILRLIGKEQVIPLEIYRRSGLPVQETVGIITSLLERRLVYRVSNGFDTLLCLSNEGLIAIGAKR